MLDLKEKNKVNLENIKIIVDYMLEWEIESVFILLEGYMKILNTFMSKITEIQANKSLELLLKILICSYKKYNIVKLKFELAILSITILFNYIERISDKNLIKVPDMFDIQFFYNGKINENVHRITRCVLENISVDYAPIGWVTYDGGQPVQTKLTLQFKEIEIVDKTRIRDNY